MTEKKKSQTNGGEIVARVVTAGSAAGVGVVAAEAALDHFSPDEPIAVEPESEAEEQETENIDDICCIYGGPVGEDELLYPADDIFTEDVPL